MFGIECWCLGVVVLRGVFGVQMWDTGYSWVDFWHWVSRYAAEHLYPDSNPPKIVYFIFVQLKHSCRREKGTRPHPVSACDCQVAETRREMDCRYSRLDLLTCLPISGQQKYERLRDVAFAALEWS